MTTMSAEERTVIKTALGVVPKVFCNTIELADLPPALLAKAETVYGTSPVAARVLSDPLRSGELQFGVLFLRDLSTDQRDHLALMAEEAIGRGLALLCILKSVEVVETLDAGPWIHISGVIEPPAIHDFSDGPTPEMDNLYGATTLAHVEQMLRQRNPKMAADAVTDLATHFVTSPNFFAKAPPS